MKLVYKNIEGIHNDQLFITRKVNPCLDDTWHYHPQYELLYISKSSGIRFVGDSVSSFSSGDLVLVGANLPHLWRNDQSYYAKDSSVKVQTVVIKFTEEFIGNNTFEKPEFLAIKKMLNQSRFGLYFGKPTSEKLHKELIGIVNLSPVEQSIKLLWLLHQLSLVDNKTLLSSSDMRKFSTASSLRIDKVLKYISDNYANNITLKDVADIACITTNSFCRFFKKATNKSFTQFLNEIRIRNAARLLIQENLSASDVCYLVGFNSLTNFYRQFKSIMGCTPNNYRKAV